MEWHTHQRRISLFVATLLTVSLPACHTDQGPTKVARYGDDLVASGSTPQVQDSVAGDAMVTGSEIHFMGASGGDYLGAGRTQTIGGRVHESLRAVGAQVHVSAVVDQNATIAGGAVDLYYPAIIGRNAYVAGRNIQIDGQVHGSLRVAGANVVLNGTVGGDVEVVAGALHLGPHADIGGNLRYRVPANKVFIDRSARVHGTTTVLPMPEQRRGWPWFTFIWMLGFLVIGLVVVGLFPQFMESTVQRVRDRPWHAVLMGLAWFILVPIAAIIVAFTVIGLPLALLMGAVYVALVFVGRVTLALWLGQRVVGANAAIVQERRGLLRNFLVGGCILVIVRLIPIVGPLIVFVATIVGIGAILWHVQGLRRTNSV